MFSSRGARWTSALSYSGLPSLASLPQTSLTNVSRSLSRTLNDAQLKSCLLFQTGTFPPHTRPFPTALYSAVGRHFRLLIFLPHPNLSKPIPGFQKPLYLSSFPPIGKTVKPAKLLSLRSSSRDESRTTELSSLAFF